jgi:H+/Cl- antiporter ClcA
MLRSFLALLLRACLVIVPVATATGAACAAFLWVLQLATGAQQAHSWLLFGLPFAGAGIAYFYESHGKNAGRGNNLILDAIHSSEAEEADDDSSLVPRRMAPLILGATVATHLFGGSAGREGTAVQMGGSLGASWARLLGSSGREKRLALLCGVAAGFGGVFGTPLAGAVFALEVLWRGRIETEEFGVCLVAALLGDWSARFLGAHHMSYPQLAGKTSALDVALAFKVALAAIAFGLAARAFTELTERIGHFFQTRINNPLLRPFCGGIGIIALIFLVRTREFLGLSLPLLARSFGSDFVSPLAWAGKIVFTALTLGSGFKGGEVTPLFVIGATLGNALSGPLHAPVALLAALGLVSVFAGASKTPLASTFLGLELFGATHAPMFALACFIATWASGGGGIYPAQRIVPRGQNQ